MLTEPEAMQYLLTTEDIKCFSQKNGTASISGLQGGVLPWSTSLDNSSFQNTLVYTGLSAGAHELVISDQNGCTMDEQFIIDEPSDWFVTLGPDTLIPFGANFVISVQVVGQPYGSIQFQWSDGQCVDCEMRTITPTSAYAYAVTATDENGCSHTDDIHVDVFIDRNLFVPNVFSPNGDQVNDVFKITSGTGLSEIEELTIYDRWGIVVFQENYFHPDDPDFQWDGTMKGKALNPAVYVYKLRVAYEDLRKEVRFGDVTLIR